MKIKSHYSVGPLLVIVLNVLLWNLQGFAETTASPSPAPSPSATSGCEDGCGLFDKFMKGVNEGKTPCRLTDAELKKTPYVVHAGTTTAQTFDGTAAGQGHKDCVQFYVTQQGWGQVGPHCMAKATYAETHNWQLSAATLYTAAVPICLAACLAEKYPLMLPYLPAMLVACSALDLGAVGTDIAAVGALKAAGHDIDYYVQELTSDSSPPPSVDSNAQQASIGAEGGVAAGVGVATGVGAAAALRARKVGGLTGTASKVARYAACASFVTDGVMAGIKWANFKRAQNNYYHECNSVQKLSWPKDSNLPPLMLENKPDGITNLDNKLQGGDNSGGALNTSSGNSSDPSKNTSPNSFAQAASAGPFAPLLASNPQAANIPNILAKMGINPDALANSLKTSNPATALGSVMDLPPEAASVLSQLQSAVDAAQVTLEGASIMQGGGGGGGGGGSSAPAFDPLSLFGKGKSPDATPGGVLDFAGRKAKEGDILDIWHAGTTDSIFKIVTKRVDESRSKIEELDWTFPFNRAVHALPQIK